MILIIRCCSAGGDGAKLYASCLVHWDAVPAAAVAAQSLLLGSRATQCMCLLSRWPFFATMRHVSPQNTSTLSPRALQLGPPDQYTSLLSLGLLHCPCLPLCARRRTAAVTLLNPNPKAPHPCTLNIVLLGLTSGAPQPGRGPGTWQATRRARFSISP